MEESRGGQELGGGRSVMLPMSIIIAAFLISGAVLYSPGAEKGAGEPQELRAELVSAALEGKLSKIPPVNSQDRIEGDADAKIKIIVYTDFECPFCKEFHSTLSRALREFSPDVALVYRHYPLSDLHPRAAKEAEAAECAGDLGGNASFWKFIGRLFEITPSNNGLDPAELPRIAQRIGIDKELFEACLAGGKYAVRIAEQAKDAESAGIEGVPYGIVFSGGKRADVIPGAIPFESSEAGELSVRGILEALLQ